MFAKVELLPIDNESKRKNSSKTTIVTLLLLVTLPLCNAWKKIYWHCSFYIFFICYHDQYHFEKQSFKKPCLFHLVYKKLNILLKIEPSLNIEHSLNFCVLFPYFICYIWMQPLKGVHWNNFALKLNKLDRLNNDREDQHHHLSDVKLLHWQEHCNACDYGLF